MLLLGRKSAEERVVSLLLAVHRHCATGDEIELPMTRLDMADYLGLTIETVSRMMTSLARAASSANWTSQIALRKLSALRDMPAVMSTRPMRSLRRRGRPSGQMTKPETDPGRAPRYG